MLMMLQFLGQVKQGKIEQGQRLVERTKPGQTVEQAGLDPKQFRRLYGRTPRAGEVLKPHTQQSKVEELTLDFLDRAPKELLPVIAASALSLGVGVPQITTATGLTEQAKGKEIKARTERRTAEVTEETSVREAAATGQAGATRAETIAAAVDRGAAAFKKLPEGTQAAIGQTAMFGKTGKQFEEGELESAVKSEMYREALKAKVDPAHPWRTMFKKEFGTDLDAAIGAAGMGMLSLFQTVAQMRASLAINASERETAITKAMAETAQKLSEATGMKFSPRAFLAEWNARELQGKTHGGELGALFDNVTTLLGRAAVTEAMKKGDPNAGSVQEILAVIRNTDDKKTIEAASLLLRNMTGKILTTQLYGPRPLEPGTGQAAWDVEAQKMGNLFGLGVERTGGLFGIKQRLGVTGTGTDRIEAPKQEPNPLHPASNKPTQEQPTTIDLPENLSAEQIEALRQIFSAFYTGGVPGATRRP
jgi:hypothetical protein